jgi:hypothetical protein
MKCYISGKITGLDYNEAFEKFEKAEKVVEGNDYEPVNPMKLHPKSDTLTWEEYMEKDIGALLRCDAIYMLSDWSDSKGARVERAIALELGYEVFYQGVIGGQNEKSKTQTKGNVIVEDIKIGDIHYEYHMGLCIKSEVISLPKKNSDGNWVWQSKSLKSGKVIDYMVNPNFASHYSVNLYDYEAHHGARQV